MKKLFVLVILVFLFSSCRNNPSFTKEDPFYSRSLCGKK